MRPALRTRHRDVEGLPPLGGDLTGARKAKGEVRVVLGRWKDADAQIPVKAMDLRPLAHVVGGVHGKRALTHGRARRMLADPRERLGAHGVGVAAKGIRHNAGHATGLGTSVDGKHLVGLNGKARDEQRRAWLGRARDERSLTTPTPSRGVALRAASSNV